MLPCMAGPAESCPESASGNGGLLGDRAENQQLLQSQLMDWVMRADLNTRLARQRGGDEAIILQVAAAVSSRILLSRENQYACHLAG